MSYNEKAAALFGAVGQRAAEQLATENPDLFLSLNAEQVFSAIVGHERLHMDEIQFENTLESILAVHKNALGTLLHTGKIIPEFSLSSRGKQQLDVLTAGFRPAPVDPRITEYQSFNKEADAVDFQLRLASDEGFRRWANAAN